MIDPLPEGDPAEAPPAPTATAHVEPPARRIGQSLGAFVDTVGHCVVVFAFARALVALPAWLSAEARNDLALHEPLVLLFMPVRALVALLDGFRAGIVPGAMAGAFDGLLFSIALCAGVVPRRHRRGLGAVCGVVAGAAMLLAVFAMGALRDRPAALGPLGVVFELGFGAACGMLAAPAARYWRGPSVSGSQ
jgi:hypothetical protein